VVAVVAGVAGCAAPERVSPIAMIGDGQHVYLADEVGGQSRILRQAVAGGALEVLATEDLSAVFAAMGTDGVFVYYSFNDQSNRTHHLMRVPVAGGPPVVLADSGTILDIKVDDANVYWSTQPQLGTPAGSVDAIAKSGGTPTVLASLTAEQPTGLALTATDLLFATGTTADGGYPGDGSIYRIAKAGGPASPIAIGPGYAPWRLVADDQRVYWLDDGYHGGSVPKVFGGGGAIASVALTGGTPTALTEAVNGPAALVLDGANLYFTVTNEQGAELLSEHGTIDRLPTAGGDPTILANAEWPRGLAVDATSVVYLFGVDGDATARVAK
jgi:hypothetical protein